MILRSKQESKTRGLRAALVLGAITVTLILGQLWLALGSEAGSPIIEHLATVSEIQVVFLTGGFQYKPPAGIDLEKLDSNVQSTVRNTLKQEELVPVASSPQRLEIFLRYIDAETTPHAYHAFHLLLELQEEAILTRKWSSSEEAVVWVTSWRDSSVILVPEEQAQKEILDEINRGVTEFAQKVTQAKHSSSKF